MKTLKQNALLCGQLITALILFGLGSPDAALAQKDDFNDGNDTNGWTRYSPLGSFGVPGNYSFPNGGYRIRTTSPSPDPGQLGPGRAGSLRSEIYSDFYITVDIVNWDPAADQAFGILARIREPGLGMTDGYALTYDSGGEDLDLTHFLNENPSGGNFGTVSVTLVTNHSYRMVFIGKGTTFIGRIYELPNLTLLAEVTGADGLYASGQTGLVLYDNTSGGTGLVDATFDNYCVQDVEPPRLAIVRGPFEGDIIVSWLADVPTNFIIQGTTTFAPGFNWTNLSPDNITLSPDGTRREYNDNVSTGPIKFYRLIRP